MALEAKNISTTSDMKAYIEGCINDFEAGISSKSEFMADMLAYTETIFEILLSSKQKNLEFPEYLAELDKYKEMKQSTLTAIESKDIDKINQSFKDFVMTVGIGYMFELNKKK